MAGILSLLKKLPEPEVGKGSALGALLGEAGLAGEIRWRRAGLADDVEVAMLGAGSVAYVEDSLRGHREGL